MPGAPEQGEKPLKLKTAPTAHRGLRKGNKNLDTVQLSQKQRQKNSQAPKDEGADISPSLPISNAPTSQIVIARQTRSKAFVPKSKPTRKETHVDLTSMVFLRSYSSNIAEEQQSTVRMCGDFGKLDKPALYASTSSYSLILLSFH